MKLKVSTFSHIKNLAAFIFFILALYNPSIAQNRPLQTIRKVTVTNQYILVNGNNSGKSVAIYQEIYDSLGRLHTEFEFDFIDHYPHKYKWHYFIGKQKVRTDFFENERLKMIRTFKYNRDSLLSNEEIKMVKPGDTTVYLSLSYKYNKQNNPIQVEAKSAKGKIAYDSKSIFDSRGTELSRKVKIKTGFPPLDSIIDMKSKPQYDSLGRLISNLISVSKVNKPIEVRNFKFTYNKKNNNIGIIILDKDGKQISREERIFQESRNRILQIKYYDSSDNVIKWLGKRYEIYPNKNRRIYEIDY